MSTACDRSAQTFFASVVGRWWAVRGSPVTYRSVIEVNLRVSPLEWWGFDKASTSENVC